MEETGALLIRHTVTLVIQEGAFRTGAAIHGHKGDATGDVSLTQRAAGRLTSTHSIGVALGLGTVVHVLGCRKKNRGQGGQWLGELAQALCFLP